VYGIINIAIISRRSVKRDARGRSDFSISFGRTPKEKSAIISLLSDSLEKVFMVAARKVSGIVIKIISGVINI